MEITHYEKTVQWPEAGLKVRIPQGTVPMGKAALLICRQAISGPFVAPPGQTFASTFYHITPSHTLLKEIELTISHAARIHSQEDCSSMRFLRAPDTPVFDENRNIEYHFSEVNTGEFRVNSKEGRIHLREFSFWCCSTSKSKS